MAIDVQSILYNYDEQKQDKKEPESRSEDLISQNTEQKALQTEVRNQQKDGPDDEREKLLSRLDEIQKHRDTELGEHSYDIDNPDVQKRLINSMSNALNIRNAQKIILLSNRENIRKGLNKEVSTGALMKGSMKGQTSTITIPTQLLRYVQQEIGGLSTRMTQNDLMTGFLYWYFGKPEDVTFGSEEMDAKMNEILDNLDLNASPAKFNRLNYNTSTTVLDKLDTLSEQINVISSLMSTTTRDSIDLKTKTDKMYIALCYNILNMLAFTPPVMPGEKPEDIDLLANGSVWDLMSGVETAYDYYKSKNGREIYKSKIRKKVNQFNYVQQPIAASPISDTNDDNDDNNDDDYGYDDYEDYYGEDDDYELIEFDDDLSNFIIKDATEGNIDDRTLQERMKEARARKNS